MREAFAADPPLEFTERNEDDWEKLDSLQIRLTQCEEALAQASRLHIECRRCGGRGDRDGKVCPPCRGTGMQLSQEATEYFERYYVVES